MTNLEWQIYKEWFSWLVEKYTPVPQGFIYMRTTPEICYKRIVKRSRSEESAIALSYLQALHKRHEDWLIGRKEIMPHLTDIPVLTIDCNDEFETNLAAQNKVLDQINQFITQQQSIVKEKTMPAIRTQW